MTDLSDHPGKICAPDYRKQKTADGLEHPIAQLPVDGIHTAGVYSNQDAVWSHPGNGDVFDLQDLGTTIIFGNDSFHKSTQHSAISIQPLEQHRLTSGSSMLFTGEVATDA